MKKYQYIKAALSICLIDFGLSEEGYKERFKNFLKSSGEEYTDLIRKEISEAIKDPEWEWKKAAKEVGFYAYDERDTEDEIFEEIKWLMWDMLFPEE
ncbi:MAG: hypothetical protein AAFX87_27500 [Bacteroidota bacterium]